MKYVIPAKATSSRVTNKNWRTFHADESLVDITIGKLIRAGVDPLDIFLSCESEQTATPTVEQWGIRFLLRPKSLCANEVPLTKWIRSISDQADPGGDEDIAWCQVCDPLFDRYAECFNKWSHIRADHDSLVVSYPWRGYLMTDTGQPIGWSFGEHHTPSQSLPQFQTMPFTLSILSTQAINATGYHVGRSPFWYHSGEQHIDIDTEQDFKIAQILYAETLKS
tara:strand:- start:3869 stop:4537 length:669 start_codon:yes stop_codon:yes gene_type:complete